MVIRIFGGLGIFLGLIWTMITYFDTREIELETRRIEAMKPFLERQLKLYTEVTQIVSLLAISPELKELQESEKRFWELYWGELALVENEFVEIAMKDFGDALLSATNQENLAILSLRLAHACRRSLAKSWNVEEWNPPTDFMEREPQ